MHSSNESRRIEAEKIRQEFVKSTRLSVQPRQVKVTLRPTIRPLGQTS